MKLIHGDCLELMKGISAGSVDMVMTSPPYDNLREYGKDFTGWGEHIWKPALDGIFRVLKDGGVCVWVVGDATIKGSETGTSFKQALYWMEIGGKLHDTMIWNKLNVFNFGSNNCYRNSFEYMFILSKGKCKTINLIKDVPTKSSGKVLKGARKHADGTRDDVPDFICGDFKKRNNVWDIKINSERINHPAVFPLQLAHDHIISWSNEGDIVLDPFMGSGTTGVACVNTNREFIGIELDEGYFKIAEDRIHEYQSQGRLF